MLKQIVHFILVLLLSSFIFHLSSQLILAADYLTDYQVQYYLSEGEHSLTTKVEFKIQITNLRSDVYVNKFSLSFPRSFLIKDLKVFDDYQEVSPVVTSDDATTKIDLEFLQANKGKGSVNTFNLQFNQDNLFQVNGNIWEVILPTMATEENATYKIIVNLPQNTDKKISISKPKPTSILGNQIVWENPSSKTVYAVFGESQLYSLDLNYHLVNPNIYPVYTDVAFPPDTLNQKVFVDSIRPLPSSTFTDEDGNYLGRYFLKPKENLTVTFSGNVEIFVKPRDEVIPVIRSNFVNQQKYLLSEKKYWEGINSLLHDRTPDATYRYVVDTLQYDYNRAAQKSERLGAATALKYPNRAVCVEFTDLFISLAREQGIYSREIEGYGFTNDQKLRPLSLISDVLHSWPEYYDTAKQIWIQLDPTWEDTSGIDYFNSFDLNHIAFAIHGKRPDYPLPAGMYKIEDSRDISITASTAKPKNNKNIIFFSDTIPTKITDNQEIKVKIIIVNKGNVFAWSTPIVINSNDLTISRNSFNVPQLAPYEKKEIEVTISSRSKNKKHSADLKITIDGTNTVVKAISILPYSYVLALKIATVVGILFLLLLIIRFIKVLRKN